MFRKIALGMACIMAVTQAHKATHCFEPGKLVGGTSESANGSTSKVTSDLLLLNKLSTEHVLTSLKVCTNRKKTLVIGVQVSYGKFDQLGEINEPIIFTPHGNLDQTMARCENIYVQQDDNISALNYRYDSNGIKNMQVVTNDKDVTYGGEPGDDEAQITGSYSIEGSAFYGFDGREETVPPSKTPSLTALGLISYDYSCVEDEQARLGEKFVWGEVSKLVQQRSFEELVEPDALRDGRERVEEFREVFDRMNQWQRYATYSTFGLNAFYILIALLYCICKCCCCCRCCPRARHSKKERE